MAKRIGIIIAALALATSAAAQPPNKKTDAQNVSGVWQMSVEADHVLPVGMELKQDGENVTGTILMPTAHIGQRREIALEGHFADGALKLSGTAEGASEDSAKIDITGTLAKDGTMSGTLSAGKHRAHWTAERLAPGGGGAPRE